MTPQEVARFIIAESDSGTLWTHGAIFDFMRDEHLKRSDIRALVGCLNDDGFDTRGLPTFLHKHYKRLITC